MLEARIVPASALERTLDPCDVKALESPSWDECERRKRELPDTLTYAEHAAACQAIARELGL